MYNPMRFFYYFFFIIFMVGFTTSKIHAQMIAVLSGSFTEDQKVCQLTFVDLEQQKILTKINCPENAAIPTGLIEYQSNIIIIAIQDRFLSKQPTGTVLAMFSPETMAFEKVIVYPGELYVQNIDSTNGLIWFFDEKNHYKELDINKFHWDVQDISLPIQSIINTTFIPNGRVLLKEETSLSILETIEVLRQPSDTSIQQQNMLRPSMFENSNPIRDVEAVFVTDRKIALWYYDRSGKGNVTIFSLEDYQTLSAFELKPHQLALGWINDGHSLLLLTSTYLQNEGQFQFDVDEFDLEAVTTTSTKRMYISTDQFGGIVSTLISHNQRYVVIGGGNAGGQQGLSPNVLITYDRFSDHVRYLELNAGSVQELCELSDNTSAFIRQN